MMSYPQTDIEAMMESVRKVAEHFRTLDSVSGQMAWCASALVEVTHKTPDGKHYLTLPPADARKAAQDTWSLTTHDLEQLRRVFVVLRDLSIPTPRARK